MQLHSISYIFVNLEGYLSTIYPLFTLFQSTILLNNHQRIRSTDQDPISVPTVFAIQIIATPNNYLSKLEEVILQLNKPKKVSEKNQTVLTLFLMVEFDHMFHSEIFEWKCTAAF